MIPRASVLLRFLESVGEFRVILKPELVAQFLDFLIVNVALRADPAFENLLLYSIGIDAKAYGVDLRHRLNRTLDCSAGSFQKRVDAIRKLIWNLDFDVAGHSRLVIFVLERR